MTKDTVLSDVNLYQSLNIQQTTTYFSQKTGFVICQETICAKSQGLFSVINKNIYLKLSSTERFYLVC